jgi:type IV pilus assembly protein PilB
VKRDEIDFGEDLVKRGTITRLQLEEAATRARNRRQGLREALTELRILTAEAFDKARAAYFGIPYIALSTYFADPQVLMLIKEDFALSEKVFPLFTSDAAIAVAISDPTNLVTLDQIRTDTQMEVQPYFAAEQSIVEAINRNYSSSTLLAAAENENSDSENAQDIPRMVDALLAQSLRAGASDLHIEPGAKQLLIRQRIDGILQEVHTLPSTLQSHLVSRIKVLAELDISETRTPQDGKIQTTIGGEDVSLRISTVPTLHGENCVIRFLVSSKARLGLDSLGFSAHMRAKFSALIARPHGMLIVTGPTGSGKTTTLYAALDQLNTIKHNIMTIEDPIEYTIDLLRQIQVNEKTGLTFASGLRAILRQDPDIVMVGEIRDTETATVAVHAALTGHLVLTTLHTNDAAGAITRLMHMGIPPFLIASSMIGVVAQRLVRRLCPSCRRPAELPENVRALVPDGNGACHAPQGCDACRKSGYRGRSGIYELLEASPEIQNAIIEEAPAHVYDTIARSQGMRPLFLDGLDKVLSGETSLEEVMAVNTLTLALMPAAEVPA